jgi:putative nucleotidyltransferase with HDIG domain
MEPGMIIAEALMTPSGQVLAPAGSEVTRQLINRMKLYRVESAQVEGEDPVSEQPVAEEPAPVPKTYVEETKTTKQKVAASSEFHSFQMQYLFSMQKLKEVFQDTVEFNKPIESKELLESVSTLFRSRNTIIELFDMLNNMRSLDDSVYAHCLNVALISRMIGRWLKLDAHDLDTLTVAGLFHDIGKVKIPEEILNKPGALTDEEFAMIKNHPRMGYDILKNQNIDPRIKKAALMHHERSDGSGYPSGLEDEFIDEFAMIIAIADVYDAMTAARSYRAPLCAFQVISNFEKDGYQKYHTKYILTFLKQIAATYQSNRVILSDGRGCKIVMLNQNDLSRPIVQFDDNTCLDLSTNRDLYIKAIV